ncbi:MAG: endonuclease/exonuclease/phosphatase family protein [Ancrocorticia sp.]|uniref:endonuclease/exonuclease/phosphatase family protein n=1 Tax=Ancrocorticia sp. TaxID=2593684 RepID=UPI003F928955
MRFVWSALSIIVVACAVVTVKPELLVADYALQTPFAQMLAMRGWIAVGLAAIGLVFLIFGALRFFVARRGRIALTFSIAMLLVAGLHAGTMYSRGITDNEALEGESTGASITVMQYNTMGGEVEASDLAETIADSGVSVVTLPETSTESGQEIVAELASRGLQFQQFDSGTSDYEADYTSTVMLVSSSLGEYSQEQIFASPANGAQSAPQGLKAVPVSGEGPTLIAVHALSPGREHMEAWASEAEQAYSLCSSEPNAIISGDFNSTKDHEAALGLSCKDAVAQAGSGAVGTWPVGLPPLLASPIDRVLTTGGYEGDSAAFVDLGGSDHRGVIVRLNPQGATA